MKRRDRTFVTSVFSLAVVVFLLGLSAGVHGATGDITTIAGSGSSDAGDFSGDDGSARAAQLNRPQGVFVDSEGAVYIADQHNHRVRRVDISGTISTIAGNGATDAFGYGIFGGDNGPATQASLSQPSSVFKDRNGNLYIADTYNNRIRKVDAQSGTMTTVVGDGFLQDSFSRLGRLRGDDGPATQASLNWPEDIFIDGSGNLFIADSQNHRIRKVDAQTGIITTVAGSGSVGFEEGGFGGDGGLAIEARLNAPNGIFVDAVGNLFIADFGNERVRKVDAQTGIITTVAGKFISIPPEFPKDGDVATEAEIGGPTDVFVDGANNIFIATTFQQIFRVDASGRLTIVAGRGIPGTALGDGGPATQAILDSPMDLFIDTSGNLYIADTDHHRIRRVDGVAEPTHLGSGSRSGGQGNLTIKAGRLRSGGSDNDLGDDGSATEALFFPQGIFIDPAGNLYIADGGYGRIRKVDAQTGIVTTVAGNGEFGFSGDGGLATDAKLNDPKAIIVDGAGNLFLADTENHRIRKVDVQTGIITTVAGNGEFGFSGDDGLATDAKLNTPEDIFIDSKGDLFIADTRNSRIRKVDSETGIITTIAGGYTIQSALVSGDILVQLKDGSGAVVQTWALNEFGPSSFSDEGRPATQALLENPNGIFIDDGGNLYISDSSRIRKIDADGIITTVAGDPEAEGSSGDGGPATRAGLDYAEGVFVDSAGNLYIPESEGRRVRKVDVETGIIRTIAGGGTASPDNGISAALVDLGSPSEIFIDTDGNLYIASSGRVFAVEGAAVATTLDMGVFGFSAALDRIPPVVQTTSPGDGVSSIDPNAVNRNGMVIAFDEAIDTGAIQIQVQSGDQNLNWLVVWLEFDKKLVLTPAYDSELVFNASYTVTLSQVKDPLGNLANDVVIRFTTAPVPGNIITTVAGGGSSALGDGGLATDARLNLQNSPAGIFVDGHGDLYIADRDHHRIRKVDAGTGLITTVAGNGRQGFSGDEGPAESANLSSPAGVFVDSTGNLYIADSGNYRIRKVDKNTGVIRTVAGNGDLISEIGDGKKATEANIAVCTDVFVDRAGNIYIADASHGLIRKVDAATNIITTVAGGGTGASSGDGGPATEGLLGFPVDIFLDGAGNLYIADGSRIRKVDATTKIITTIVGSGRGFSGDGGPAAQASLKYPQGVFVDDAGNIFIADSGNYVIRKVDSAGIISTIVGNGSRGFSGDGGPAILASLWSPIDVFADGASNLFIADAINSQIRRVEGIAAPTNIYSSETGSTPSSPGTSASGTDFTGDGKTDFSDFLLFARQFGKSQGDAGFDLRFDLNGNGSVDFSDFLVFAQNYGK